MPYFGDRSEHAAYESDMDDMAVSSRRFADVDVIMDNLSDDVLDQYGHEFGEDGSDDLELFEDEDWSEYDLDALESDEAYNDIAI